MSAKPHWWIDTDPGVDDAWAILMMRAAEVDVVGVSVVAGTLKLEHTARNALRLVDLFAAPPPVFAGCAKPMIGGLPDAAFVHGADGFGDALLPPPAATLQQAHGAQALIDASFREPLNLLALGPLTNIALALMLDPTLPSRCARFVVMGGAVNGQGNTAIPSAEFNIGFDPEAAAMVFSRWPGIELVDWSLTLRAAPGVRDVLDWLSASAPLARWMRAITHKTEAFVREREAGQWAWADPLAAFVALHPDCARYEHFRVRVECGLGAARGQTIVDRVGISGWQDPMVAIVADIDTSLFHEHMRQALL